MVGQLHLTRVPRKSCSLRRRDVEKHLLRISGDDLNRAISHFHRRPLAMRKFILEILRGAAGGAVRDYGFPALHVLRTWGPTSLASAVILNVGIDTADLARLPNARRPPDLMSPPFP